MFLNEWQFSLHDFAKRDAFFCSGVRGEPMDLYGDTKPPEWGVKGPNVVLGW